jgi:hypothetical protein
MHLKTKGRKEKIMAAGDLERKYWARIWAKAIKEAKNSASSLKTKLETDPLLAHRQVKGEFGSLPKPVIDDIKNYGLDIGVDFSGKTVPELQRIIDKIDEVEIHPNELKKA